MYTDSHEAALYVYIPHAKRYIQNKKRYNMFEGASLLQVALQALLQT